MKVLNNDVSVLAKAVVDAIVKGGKNGGESGDESDGGRCGESGGRFDGKRIVCLMGDLGAGKTTLTQAVCGLLGVKDDVVSPTFSIINVYRGGRAFEEIYHIDLYRIDDVSELDEIGFDEILYSDALVIVEWADRYAQLFPDEALWIKLGIEEDGTRYAVLPDEMRCLSLF